MEARADSFLEDFSPLSQALIGAQINRGVQAVSASVFFITIENKSVSKALTPCWMRGVGTLEYRLL